MAKRTPLSDIDTIHLKYFEAGYDPNKPNDPRVVVFEPSKLWAKFHGEWHRCPEKTVRAQIGALKRAMLKESNHE